MWVTGAYGESRQVTLLLGQEKVSVEEDTSFLADFSGFFETMFYVGFAESTLESVNLPDCDATAFQTILENMKEAKNNDMSVEQKIGEFLTPKLYPVLQYIMIKADLDLIAMHKMTHDQMQDYKKIAKDMENYRLEKAVLSKSLGTFHTFRRTKLFKTKSLADLKIYLSHKHLEYKCEKEILEAVLWWLNFNFKRRELYIEEVLSLVNWRGIQKNQARFVCIMKVVQKSEKLQDIMNSIFEYKSEKCRGHYSIDKLVPMPEGKAIAYKLLKNRPKRQWKRLLISVPFAFKANEIDLDYKFGVCFYDAASDTLLKDYYLQSEGRNDIFGHFDTEFYDFNMYSFASMAEFTKRGDRQHLAFQVEKCDTYLKNWETVGEYGRRNLSASELETEMASQSNAMQQRFTDNQRIDDLRLSNPQADIDSRMSPNACITRLVAYLLARENQMGLLAPQGELPFYDFKNFRPSVYRSGTKIYISHIGVDVLDTTTNRIRNAWDVQKLSADAQSFHDNVMYRGGIRENRLEVQVKNLKTGFSIPLVSGDMDLEPTTLKAVDFVTPVQNYFVFTGIGHTTIGRIQKIGREKTRRANRAYTYYEAEPEPDFDCVRFKTLTPTRLPAKIFCQFQHNKKLWMLLAATDSQNQKVYSLTKIKVKIGAAAWTRKIGYLNRRVSELIAADLKKPVFHCKIRDTMVKPVNPLWFEKLAGTVAP